MGAALVDPLCAVDIARTNAAIQQLGGLVVQMEKKFFHIMQTSLTKAAPAEFAFGFPFDVKHASNYLHAMTSAVEQYAYLATIRVQYTRISTRGPVDMERFEEAMIDQRPSKMSKEFVHVLVSAVRAAIGA